MTDLAFVGATEAVLMTPRCPYSSASVSAMRSLSHSGQVFDYGVLSCGAGVVEVEDDERRGDDLAYLPGFQADVAYSFERHLQQGVAALADRPDAVVGLVELLLDEG